MWCKQSYVEAYLGCKFSMIQPIISWTFDPNISENRLLTYHGVTITHDGLACVVSSERILRDICPQQIVVYFHDYLETPCFFYYCYNHY